MMQPLNQRVVALEAIVQPLDQRIKAAEFSLAEHESRWRSFIAPPGFGGKYAIVQENASFFPPYRPKRRGLKVRYEGNHLTPEQPDSMWFDMRLVSARPMLLRGRIQLEPGDEMVIQDDCLFDLSIGPAMVKVHHQRAEKEGFITLQTLIAATCEGEGTLWTARDQAALRSLVEARTKYGHIYSTNRVGEKERAETIEYLGQFDGSNVLRPSVDFKDVHPLQAGAHAHRVAVWALDCSRSPSERDRIAGLVDIMFEKYGIPAMQAIGNGDAVAWPYGFDFVMPWGTKLKTPWFSGYANSAMVGAAACAWRLTGKEIYRDIVKRGVAFLRRPMKHGGAYYEADGYSFVAEYCYSTPPIPNYRVLDGEMCSLVYLYNAALLTEDTDILEFAIELCPGLALALDMFCTDDGLPVFGMDGQPMNPGYMWQLWMTLQLLANAFKDRHFSEHAAAWRSGIPESDIQAGFPG